MTSSALGNPPKSLFVLRGGSWNNDAMRMRSTNRNRNQRTNRNRNDGARLASLPGPTQSCCVYGFNKCSMVYPCVDFLCFARMGQPNSLSWMTGLGASRATERPGATFIITSFPLPPTFHYYTPFLPSYALPFPFYALFLPKSLINIMEIGQKKNDLGASPQTPVNLKEKT